MSLSTQAATTLEALKTYLKIPAQDTSRDDLLEVLIESCTQAAESYINRYIVQRDITEEPHDAEASRSKYLQLAQYPVNQITAVLQNGEKIPLATLKIDKQNGILKKPSFWNGAVLISYSAGIAQNSASVPKNIQMAIWQWIAGILALQDSNGLKSESLGDYSAAYYDAQPLPLQVQTLLECYRKAGL